MRELDRRAAESTSFKPAASGRSPLSVGGTPVLEPICVVGRGRLGAPLADALRRAGLTVAGPWGRADLRARARAARAAEVVLLCVPDGEIAGVAASLHGAAPFVGHTSGATPLAALAGAGDAVGGLFGLHPLQTFTGTEGDPAARLRGAGAAIAGSTPAAEAAAHGLAQRLGMEPLAIDDSRRAAYHAAASIASNFLVTLQDAAETLAGAAGMSPSDARRALAPLVRVTVDNWAELGPQRSLTGPVARGDWETVDRHRAAVAGADPTLAPLFEALVERTHALAARGEGVAARSTASVATGRPA
jgi:predicted short-subunit dehydrogenase-like oxidoreductase (DUF2520 family)